MSAKAIIWIIAALIIVYLLLSRQSKVPAAIDWISSSFRWLWNPLTGVEK